MCQQLPIADGADLGTAIFTRDQRMRAFRSAPRPIDRAAVNQLLHRPLYLYVCFIALRAFLAMFELSVAQAESPPTIAWERQLGTTLADWSYGAGVSVDGLGNVYLAGFTDGALGGANTSSDAFIHADTFLAKFDATGSLAWTQQFGTGLTDRGFGVSADQHGHVYLSGETDGNFAQPDSSEGQSLDVFLAKYDDDGTQRWWRQLGTRAQEFVGGVAADQIGNIFVAGSTQGQLASTNAGSSDAFLAKYNSDGDLIWTRQLGSTAQEVGRAVTTDGQGNAYISGWTLGDLQGANNGGEDAFVAKYDTAGKLLWTRQIGTSAADFSHGVSVDSLGNVYLAGGTYSEESPVRKAVVTKFDSDGHLVWAQQFGPAYGLGISANGNGRIFVVGETDDVLAPDAVYGGADAFLATLDADGNRLSVLQFAPMQFDVSEGVAADGAGHVFMAGYTSGNVGGPNVGDFDVFVIKLNETVPEPSSCSLVSAGVLALVGFQ